MTRGSLRTSRQLLTRTLGLVPLLLLLALPTAALPASAQVKSQKIAPALLTQMTANPLQLLRPTR